MIETKCEMWIETLLFSFKLISVANVTHLLNFPSFDVDASCRGAPLSEGVCGQKPEDARQTEIVFMCEVASWGVAGINVNL